MGTLLATGTHTHGFAANTFFRKCVTARGSQSGQLQSGALACKRACTLMMCLCARVHLTAEDTAGAVGVSPFFKAWEEKGKGG